MSSAKPTRKQADLADVLELILDKGIVINADIVITVGQTEMLGIEIRAAIASFETAAEYGLAFPSGTDMRRVERASGREPLDDEREVDLGIGASNPDGTLGESREPPSKRPRPTIPFASEENAEEFVDEDDDGRSADEEDTEKSTDGDDAEESADEDGAEESADEEDAEEKADEEDAGDSSDRDSEES